MRISDWSSYVCSSDLLVAGRKDMWLVLQAVARGNFDQFDLRHLGYSIGALRVTVGPTASPRPAGPTRIRRTAARDRRLRRGSPYRSSSEDRKSDVSGKRVTVRVNLAGRLNSKKNIIPHN